MHNIDFQTFVKLFKDAKESPDQDLFIAELGWQDWMDSLKITEVFKILCAVFKMAHSNLKYIRKACGYTQQQLAKEYYIPMRTLQGWEAPDHDAPVYVELMLMYTLLPRMIGGEGGANSK